MADTILKAKIQLRSTSVNSNGSSNNGDGTPPTPSKLMINHGKPNFTIQRSPKIQQNGADGDIFANGKNNNYNAFKTASTQSYNNNNNNNKIQANNNNNNNNIVVSTKFNGAFKATNVASAPKQPHQSDVNDNEAAKVILRRAKAPEPSSKDNEDDSVPEFIRRQRRIQERLANQNILDFENRRSGYFTHVMISPTSPNRQSFGATMSSPPIVPALETPAPALTTTTTTTTTTTAAAAAAAAATNEETKVDEQQVESVMTNGNDFSHEHNTTAEEEEVANAIEEVNKAVEGEDDEKDDHNLEAGADTVESTIIHNDHTEEVAVANGSIEEEHKHDEKENLNSESTVQNVIVTVNEAPDAVEKTIEHNIEQNVQNDHAEDVAPQENRHTEVVEVHTSQENDHKQNDIIISHTNGFDGPNIPSPDPSGALGVNYEPKTVVSFSKELGSEPNKYPDTVKVVSENGNVVDEKLQELSKLKFDIKADEQDVQVTSVLRTD